MRILITNTGPWGTGSGTVADAVMQELLKKGHEVKAFFPDAGFPGDGVEKYYGDRERYEIVPFPVVHKNVELYTFPLIIPDPNPRNYSHAWTFRNMTDLQLQAYFSYMKQNLKKVLDDYRPDVVECQHIWALDYIVHELGYPYVCVAHHSDQMGFAYDLRMQTYAGASARAAKVIIAISEYVRQEVIDLYQVPAAKVVVSTNGYNKEIFRPMDLDRRAVLDEFGLGRFCDMKLITFCGKLSRTKGVDILLQANAAIQKKSPVGILLMGGGDLEEICAGMEGPYSLENVVCLGQRSQTDLARLHNLSWCSVLPSRSEGFGIAALEAMGCGRPVVATKVGGLPDFIVGSLVDPAEPKGLAAAISALLLQSEAQHKSQCRQALARAEQYSWSSIVDQRLEIYECLCREKAAALPAVRKGTLSALEG